MADPTLPPKRPGRLWRIVLVISLALNLAVAGIVVGAVTSGRAGKDGLRSFELASGPLAGALAPAERRQIGRSLRENRALRGVNPRESINAMITVIMAEPFDPAALEELMMQQSQRMGSVQVQARAALLQVISDMTPERRAAFAAALTEEMSKPRRRP